MIPNDYANIYNSAFKHSQLIIIKKTTKLSILHYIYEDINV